MEKARDAIDCFQRLVSLLYREIGVLKRQNHTDVAAKAKLSAPFFKDRKREAKRLCRGGPGARLGRGGAYRREWVAVRSEGASLAFPPQDE